MQVFPNIPMDSMERPRFYPMIAEDLKTEEDLERWAHQMFEDPEARFFYFHQEGTPANPLFNTGEITWNRSEFGFYEHHNNRDFIKIEPNEDGSYAWEWQKEYVETRPRYVRHQLKLSARKHRQLDTVARLEEELAFQQRLIEKSFSSDVFLSFASRNHDLAESIQQKLIAANKKVFFSAKNLKGGQDFADEIRDGLRRARQLWLLVSPESLKSEWVMTEWGAAWVLEKPIVPILYHCSPEGLPDRLKRFQAIDYHEVDNFIAAMNGAKPT